MRKNRKTKLWSSARAQSWSLQLQVEELDFDLGQRRCWKLNGRMWPIFRKKIGNRKEIDWWQGLAFCVFPYYVFWSESHLGSVFPESHLSSYTRACSLKCLFQIFFSLLRHLTSSIPTTWQNRGHHMHTLSTFCLQIYKYLDFCSHPSSKANPSTTPGASFCFPLSVDLQPFPLKSHCF